MFLLGWSLGKEHFCRGLESTPPIGGQHTLTAFLAYVYWLSACVVWPPGAALSLFLDIPLLPSLPLFLSFVLHSFVF